MRTKEEILKHVEKVASQRIVESMPGGNFEEDCNHLTMLLATVMENEDFEYDEEKDLVEPKVKDEFLKRIEENCEEVPDKEQKLSDVKNKVLEKMKKTLRPLDKKEYPHKHRIFKGLPNLFNFDFLGRAPRATVRAADTQLLLVTIILCP